MVIFITKQLIKNLCVLNELSNFLRLKDKKELKSIILFTIHRIIQRVYEDYIIERS